jgi:polysaccharide export outer membrane protein
MRAFRLTIVFFAVCLSLPWAHAQSNPTATPVPQPDIPEPAQLWNGNLGSDPVGDGDLVYISVTGSPELSRSYRISDDGSLSLPLLKEKITVAGMVPTAIARAVSDALIHGQILVAPIVTAAVLEYRSRRVTVVGAVKAPTIIQAAGELKLLNAIARAQGFSAEAGPEVIVTRPANTGGVAETIRIPIKELLSGNKPALDIALHGGEEIRVPDAPRLFIMGNVKLPGSYPINEMGGTSVLKALALSQGVLSYSSKQAYVYRTVAGSNQRQEIEIPLRNILERKSPDVQLQPNDILYVPENSRLRMKAALLERIIGFGGAAGSGLALK